eukprot:scaffold3341_cov153-Isochrysis_galbana.AAC.1
MQGRPALTLPSLTGELLEHGPPDISKKKSCRPTWGAAKEMNVISGRSLMANVSPFAARISISLQATGSCGWLNVRLSQLSNCRSSSMSLMLRESTRNAPVFVFL